MHEDGTVGHFLVHHAYVFEWHSLSFESAKATFHQFVVLVKETFLGRHQDIVNVDRPNHNKLFLVVVPALTHIPTLFFIF